VRSYYIVKSQLSGLAMTVQGSRRNPAGVVVSKQLTGNNDNQLWYDDPMTGTVRSKFNGYCLDVEGENAVLKLHQSGSSTQLWERCGSLMRRTTSQNIVLGIYGGSVNNGARVTVGMLTGSQHQMFDFITTEMAPVESGATACSAEPLPVKVSLQQAVVLGQHGKKGLGKPDPSLKQDQFYIISEMNCKVLDIEGENPVTGTKVIMWPKKSPPAANQLWYFDEQRFIRSVLNDFVLEASVGGAVVKMMPYSGSPLQQWTLEGNRILNKARECLDIRGGSSKNGAELVSYQYKGSANQHWRIEYIGSALETRCCRVNTLTSAMSDMNLKSRHFYIISEMNCKVLDIQGGNSMSGTSVIMWPKKSVPQANQLWYFDPQGFIRSALNDFVMVARVGGEKIKMMPYTGSPMEQWTLDGNRIMNRAHECLDIRGESKKDGAELISYKYKRSANQHWRIEYV